MGKTVYHNDQVWLLAIGNRERDALSKVYHDVFPSVRKLVVNAHGNEEDAWDVFQEMMIVLHRKVNDPDFQLTSKLSTFLVGIARLIWLKKNQKKRKTLLTNEIPETYIVNDDDMMMAERERLFREKLLQLGDQCQQILQLFFQKMKMQDIAKKMNLASAEVARITKYRCTKKLTKLVQDDQAFTELSNR